MGMFWVASFDKDYPLRARAAQRRKEERRKQKWQKIKDDFARKRK